jgi:hypothetical protein
MRAIALLGRGFTVDEAVVELQRRYHSSAPLEDVKRAYFPKGGPTCISNLQGKGHAELLAAMRKINERLRLISLKSKFMWTDPDYAENQARLQKLRNTDPEIAKRRSEAAKRQWEDPDFAQKHYEMMKRRWENPAFAKMHSEMMKRRWEDPEFAKRHSERMRRLHADPDFRTRYLDGLSRFWGMYYAKKRGIFGKSLGWENEVPVPIEGTTPEELTYASYVHELITNAVIGLPSQHRFVVVEEFNLDLPLSVTAEAILSTAEKEQLLEQALGILREHPALRAFAEAETGR